MGLGAKAGASSNNRESIRKGARGDLSEHNAEGLDEKKLQRLEWDNIRVGRATLDPLIVGAESKAFLVEVIQLVGAWRTLYCC